VRGYILQKPNRIISCKSLKVVELLQAKSLNNIGTSTASTSRSTDARANVAEGHGEEGGLFSGQELAEPNVECDDGGDKCKCS